ncbi:MAG: 5'-nucleotidase C-terminal domain-containing protein [Clostridium sp.]|nr:5'-nucleotidase C-terminal domain-containing protein [Clostridium sp.]
MKKTYKSLTWLITTFLFIFSTLTFLPLQTVYAAQATGSTPAVVILHTGDVHGSFAASEDAIGHDVIAAYYQQTKAQTPATFLVDTGDALQGNFFVNSNLGEAAVDIMNTVRYDVMSLGNHDFDFEWSQTLALAKMAQFPFLTQESVIAGDDAIASTTMIDRGGYKIGFFGITTPETKQSSNGGFDRDFGTIDSLINYATETASSLRAQGADLVICLSHLGVVAESGDLSFGTSYALSAGAKGIDVIIDGHSHTPLDEVVQKDGDIPITSAGSDGESIGVVEFYLENETLVPHLRSIAKADVSSIAPDAEVTNVIDEWIAAEKVAGDKVVGHSPVSLDFNETSVRTTETAIGNLVADALLYATGADISLVNGGNICAALPKGDVTRAQINAVLPYANMVLSAQVSGSVIKQVLEHSVSAYPQSQGGFMQVAGMSFVFDPSKPAGSRIVSVTVDGKDLADDQTYQVVSNDFIVAGGDGYEMLIEPFLTATIHNPSDMAEVFAAYITNNSDSLDPKVEGRITTFGTQSQAEDGGNAQSFGIVSGVIIAVVLIAIVAVLFLVKKGKQSN